MDLLFIVLVVLVILFAFGSFAVSPFLWILVALLLVLLAMRGRI